MVRRARIHTGGGAARLDGAGVRPVARLGLSGRPDHRRRGDHEERRLHERATLQVLRQGQGLRRLREFQAQVLRLEAGDARHRVGAREELAKGRVEARALLRRPWREQCDQLQVSHHHQGHDKHNHQEHQANHAAVSHRKGLRQIT